MDQKTLEEVKEVIKLYIADSKNVEQLYDRLERILGQGQNATLHDRLEGLVLQVSLVAENLGKKALNTVYHGEDQFLEQNEWMVMSGIFSHLIRNSLDHGVETSEKRNALGKAPEGTIDFKVERRKDRLLIKMKDDGAGLNLGKLREKGGMESTAPKEKVAELIFQSDLSTAEKVTISQAEGWDGRREV